MQRPWGRNMPGVRAETQPQGLERRAWGGPAALGCGGVWDGSQARASCVMGVERAGTAVAGCGRTHALTTVGRRSSSRVRSGLDVSVPRLFWLQRLLGAP